MPTSLCIPSCFFFLRYSFPFASDYCVVTAFGTSFTESTLFLSLFQQCLFNLLHFLSFQDFNTQSVVGTLSLSREEVSVFASSNLVVYSHRCIFLCTRLLSFMKATGLERKEGLSDTDIIVKCKFEFRVFRNLYHSCYFTISSEVSRIQVSYS